MIVFCTGGRRPAKKFSSGRSNKIFARDRETRFRSEAGPRCAQSEKKKGRGEGEGGCCYFKTFQTMILPVSIQPPHSPPPLLCMCARACIVDTFYWLLQKFNILLPSPLNLAKFVELLFLERIIRCFCLAKFGIGQLCDE